MIEQELIFQCVYSLSTYNTVKSHAKGFVAASLRNFGVPRKRRQIQGWVTDRLLGLANFKVLGRGGRRWKVCVCARVCASFG